MYAKFVTALAYAIIGALLYAYSTHAGPHDLASRVLGMGGLVTALAGAAYLGYWPLRLAYLVFVSGAGPRVSRIDRFNHFMARG